MELTGVFQIFGVGFFGGIVGEIAKWYQLRESTNLPKYAASFFYWAITAAMAGAGGVLACLYGLEKQSAILVFNIGLSAPLIIKAMAEQIPDSNASLGPGLTPQPSVLGFISGRS